MFTLLLDLDGSLLKNNIDDFLPHYLKLFSSYLAARIDPNLFVNSLLKGTQAMVQNRLPDCTLKEVFDSVFFPLTGTDPEEFQPLADRFYDDFFPSLGKLTEPVPQAVEMVQGAFQKGWQLAVTTNPLFPCKAMLQRLSWAGLSADRFPFRLITSYETFHFAKPDPAYFAESLGLLGWPDDGILVVGDDFERDILPAHTLGLDTYWLKSDTNPMPDLPNTKGGRGELSDLMEWIESRSPEALEPDYDTPGACLAILRSTPAVLDSLTRSLDGVDWTRKPASGEWSLTEILCHLRDVDREVNLTRLKKVIESKNPFIPGQDTDLWADERGYAQQDGKRAFREFIAARMSLVGLLEQLAPADWDRPVRHAIFGPTRFLELVNIIAAHDRLHLQQVHGLLGHIPLIQ